MYNTQCIRHSINRIQSKGHTIGTYEINEVSLSCFDDKNISKKFCLKIYIRKYFKQFRT